MTDSHEPRGGTVLEGSPLGRSSASVTRRLPASALRPLELQSRRQPTTSLPGPAPGTPSPPPTGGSTPPTPSSKPQLRTASALRTYDTRRRTRWQCRHSARRRVRRGTGDLDVTEVDCSPGNSGSRARGAGRPGQGVHQAGSSGATGVPCCRMAGCQRTTSPTTRSGSSIRGPRRRNPASCPRAPSGARVVNWAYSATEPIP
jgi:hypothetical protein